MQNEIEAFLSIVRLGNLSNAAKQLFISQSTISQRLSSLEKELKISLIKRSRGVESATLTPAGQKFWTIALKWEELMTEARGIKDNHYGETISIGAVDSVNSFILNNLYSDLIISNPNTKVIIRTHQSDELYDLIERREVDVGFVLQERISKNYNTEKVFDEELVFITKNPEQINKKVTISELDPTKEVYINWGLKFQQWHEKWFENTGSLRTQVDTGNLLISLLLSQDDRWAVVPVSLAKAYQNETKVEIYRITDDTPSRSCFMIYNDKNEKQPKVTNWMSKNKSILFDVVRYNH